MNNYQIDPEVEKHNESHCGFVESNIRAAIRAGAFDNLPGRGKPLKLDEQVHVKPELRLAFRLVR